MRGPWIVGERATILGEVRDKVKKDTAAAYSMRCPIFWRKKVVVGPNSCKKKKQRNSLTLYSELLVFLTDRMRIVMFIDPNWQQQSRCARGKENQAQIAAYFPLNRWLKYSLVVKHAVLNNTKMP